MSLWWLRLRKLWAAALVPRYRRAARQRVFPSIEHRGVPLRRDYETVLDCGANSGQFALFALQRFPQAHIHSFEPLPQALTRFRSVLMGTDGDADRVTVHPVALGAEHGEGMLHIAADDDGSSLLPLLPTRLTIFPGGRSTGTIRVPIERLDARVPARQIMRPALLKIDVQGYELEVLRGAVPLLPMLDELLIECSFVPLYGDAPLASEIVQFLGDHGFSLTGEYSPVSDHTGEAVQADLLFTRVAPPD